MDTPTETHPQPPEPARDARAQLRRVVLETAARVLAQDAGASIEDIAHASGVGRATLYRWFASREQLVDAILEQILAEAGEIARAALAERGVSPLAAIQGMAAEFLALGERYRFMEARLERADEDEQLRADFVAFVAAAQSGGQLRDELPAEWVGSMLAGVVLAAGKDIASGRLTRHRAAELVQRTLALMLEVR